MLPDPAVQPGGTWPLTVDGLGCPRWNGITFPVAAFAVDAPLPEASATIPYIPHPRAIAAAMAATRLVVSQLNMDQSLRSLNRAYARGSNDPTTSRELAVTAQ